jgi:hypothetical protein
MEGLCRKTDQGIPTTWWWGGECQIEEALGCRTKVVEVRDKDMWRVTCKEGTTALGAGG